MNTLAARCVVTLMLCLFLMACDDDSNPTEPEVEEPAVVERVTESFSGRLQLGETACHDVVSTQTGNIDMTITGLAPLGTLTIGMGIGLPDDTADTGCSLFASDQSVRVGNLIRSTQLAAAAYCVCVFDVGNIFADQSVSYAVNVTHP